jgi:hypothetical protein
VPDTGTFNNRRANQGRYITNENATVELFRGLIPILKWKAWVNLEGIAVNVREAATWKVTIGPESSNNADILFMRAGGAFIEIRPCGDWDWLWSTPAAFVGLRYVCFEQRGFAHRIRPQGCHAWKQCWPCSSNVAVDLGLCKQAANIVAEWLYL